MKKLNGKKLVLVAPVLAIAILFLGGCEHNGWHHHGTHSGHHDQ